VISYNESLTLVIGSTQLSTRGRKVGSILGSTEVLKAGGKVGSNFPQTTVLGYPSPTSIEPGEGKGQQEHDKTWGMEKLPHPLRPPRSE
jgi:hypothetical protein